MVDCAEYSQTTNFTIIKGVRRLTTHKGRCGSLCFLSKSLVLIAFIVLDLIWILPAMRSYGLERVFFDGESRAHFKPQTVQFVLYPASRELSDSTVTSETVGYLSLKERGPANLEALLVDLGLGGLDGGLHISLALRVIGRTGRYRLLQQPWGRRSRIPPCRSEERQPRRSRRPGPGSCWRSRQSRSRRC
jgi:hypothetical protein